MEAVDSTYLVAGCQDLPGKRDERQVNDNKQGNASQYSSWPAHATICMLLGPKVISPTSRCTAGRYKTISNAFDVKGLKMSQIC